MLQLRRMRKFGGQRVSRRKLLGGAAAAGAVPVLHELIPHQGLHGGTSPAAAAVAHHKAGHTGSDHRGAVGRVAASANGFDPTAILRDFDEGTVSERRPRMGDRGRGPRDRGGARGQVRGLDLQRPRSGPHAAGARGRAAARALRQRVEPPAHDALPRHPPRRDGRRARHRRGQHRAGPLHDLRVRRHSVRPAPLPLPLDPARRAHREGPLRRVRDRPRRRPRRRPTSS